MNLPTSPANRLSGNRRWLQLPAVALGVIVLAAACGSSSSSATKSAAQPSQGGAGASAGTRARPGTTGKIAQVNAGSIFVQSTSSQVTVNYNAKTTLTQTLNTTASALKVGDCVTAVSARTGSPSATPSPSSGPATAITASNVTITSTSGTCTLGNGARGQGGAPGGAFPSGRARPSGSPSNRAGRAGGGFGGAAFGSVASVGDGTFVVTSTRNSKTTKVTVTTNSSTTFRQQAAATTANLKVGLCATAIGTTDDTGAVTARTIALSTAGADGCTQAGFGGGFGRFRPGAGGSGSAG